MVEGCEGWVVLVKEVGLWVGSGVGRTPVVDIGFSGLGSGSKLTPGCRTYLSFASRLCLTFLIVPFYKDLRPTKCWSLTIEEVLYPLPSSFPTVSYLLGNLNVIDFRSASAGGHKLSLRRDEDGSITPWQRRQVGDWDGHILWLAFWSRRPHPVGSTLPQVGQPLQLLLLETSTEGVGPAEAKRGDNNRWSLRGGQGRGGRASTSAGHS